MLSCLTGNYKDCERRKQFENRGKELHDIGLKVVKNISYHIYIIPNKLRGKTRLKIDICTYKKKLCHKKIVLETAVLVNVNPFP